MIVLEIVSCIILGLCGLYLAIGLAFLLPEILWAITILLTAPLKMPKQIPNEYFTYTAPLLEQVKEIPELLKDWAKATYFWIILPFLVIKALCSKEAQIEQGE